MFETLVQCDGRLIGAVYVVERDHVIEYAGTRFHEARTCLRGNEKLIVWLAGNYLGLVDYDGRWTYKTQHNGEQECSKDC